MYDFLFAYTFEPKYKPGRETLVADMLSRLPLPATKKADGAPDVRLTDPSDLDVYMIGARGVQPSRVGPVFSGQEASAESTHREIFVVWRRMAVELCRLLLVRLRSSPCVRYKDMRRRGFHIPLVVCVCLMIPS